MVGVAGRKYVYWKVSVGLSACECLGFLDCRNSDLRLLRTNSPAKSAYYNINNFKARFQARGYPHISHWEKNNPERKSALQQNEKVRNKILAFFATYHPALPNLKNIL